VRLTFSSDSVVVVAGLPGAGKTTLIRRAAERGAVCVVDTDDRPRRGPLLYAGHYGRIVAAIAGSRPAMIHSRGTHPYARRAIATLAALRGRPAHLVLIDAERAEAEAGQRARGRVIDASEMARQERRWRRLMTGGPGHEGWRSIVVLDRARAGDVEAFEFAGAESPKLAAATI
jgi:hypothetical protein